MYAFILQMIYVLLNFKFNLEACYIWSWKFKAYHHVPSATLQHLLVSNHASPLHPLHMWPAMVTDGLAINT